MLGSVWRPGSVPRGRMSWRRGTWGPDPGDQALLERAAAEGRVLVTIDTDFGELVYVQAVPHAGMVRLPDVPAEERIALMAQVLERHREALEVRAIITVRRRQIRISRPPI